jgi:hypothetical protein
VTRLAKYSVTYDGNESGDHDVVINAGSDKGFAVTGVLLNWQPTLMSGDSDMLPNLAIARYVSAASGGTAGSIFSHTDGDVASATARINPSTLGSGLQPGPISWPGSASYTSGAWYQGGGQNTADFAGNEIYVAKNHSLWVRVAHVVSATIYFREGLTP